MAQLVTVRLNKSEQQPLGFRLQGGKDFGTPLVVQKVNGGSAAERAGLQAGDALIRVNNTEVYTLRHQEAQDAIRAAGGALELTVQRGGNTWRPSVTPTGSLPRPGRTLGSTPTPVTQTSLKANPQQSRAFGSGHNNVAKPFGYMNGGGDSVKGIVNKQYNTPVAMYSDKTIAETLSAQTEVLAGGVLGVNFKKNEKTYDAEKSEVFKMLQEAQNDPEPEIGSPGGVPPVSGLRHVSAPVTRPDAPINNTGGLPPGQNICEDCERLITGVFVRIKDKNLHVECFKCATCGTSLKNQGYYNLNGKLYCDIHAKLVARQNPPASNLEPVTVPPGGRIPTNSYSTPLPPLATNNYTNGSSSLFSPSSTLSGPKPFGSSLGSAYSPASLSPRSAPMSPARPMAAPAHISAPAPAPFAPTKNIKSVVWPPPNPSEDEPPMNVHATVAKNTSCNIIQSKQVEQAECTKMTSSKEASRNHKTVEKMESTSKQSAEVSSTSTFSSTQMSSAVTASSIAQSEVYESTSVVSTSEQISSSQSLAMYESQTSPPIQKSFKNPIETMAVDTKPTTTTNVVARISTANEQQVSTKSATIIQSSDPESKPICNVETSEKSIAHTSDQKFVKVNDNVIANELKESQILQQCNTINGEKEQLVERIENTSETPAGNKNIENSLKEDMSTDSICSNNQDVTKPCEKAVKLENIKIQPDIPPIKPLPPSNIPNSVPKGFVASMVGALTTAPDRPYSPLPPPPQPITLPCSDTIEEIAIPVTAAMRHEMPQTIPEPSPMFTSQPKRAITPIPPVKPYNPPEKKDNPIPMPPETAPYIPPDFKINIEPKVQRDVICGSPMVEALTTAPERPFTPVVTPQPIERGSLLEALTIAPDRSYSPLPLNVINQSSQFSCSTSTETSTTHVQCTSSEIARPIATQTTTQMSERVHSEMSKMQNVSKLQTSTGVSAFRPVVKQTFPPPQPENICNISDFPPMSTELQTNFAQAQKRQSMVSESQMMQETITSSSVDTKSFSSVKASQCFFEQLNQKETMSSTAVRSKAGLHKADNIPSYQKQFDKLPSQRGITPEICNAPAVLQRPVTPITDPPIRPREKSQDRSHIQSTFALQPEAAKHAQQPQMKPYIPQAQPVRFNSDAPISMTFQPVSDESMLRASPARSRPTTPSLINKPAPIIPHYQMNLVAVEHIAADSHLYEPSSPETSRSPTPKLRSRSPAQGPPPNPLKAQAPRIKEGTPQRQASHSLLTQATSNLRKEHDSNQKMFQSNLEIFNASGAKNWGQNKPSIIKEQRQSNVGFQSETYNKGDMKVKEDSIMSLNSGQRQMKAHHVEEFGNTVIQSTRKCFEEFESRQSAKVIEIHKGGSQSSNQYQDDSDIAACIKKPKQVFPPPVMTLQTLSQQTDSINQFKDVTATSSNLNTCQPSPSISGANKGPVCDPTPSTGSSVGAAARGKTFGVSSAPKRGRGVLNKAALPVNESQNQNSPQRPDFKSPAEERLIRKMAKMALNGYEIGIQRKIKPADHIQSMAEKIQDTVVTKHPLNSDNVTSSESSRENTLSRSTKQNGDKGYKIADNINSIGDKIKNTIMSNHPGVQNFTNGNIPPPPPPPIPTTPIPTLNAHSTPIGNTTRNFNGNNNTKNISAPKFLSNFINESVDVSDVTDDKRGTNTIKNENTYGKNVIKNNNNLEKPTETIKCFNNYNKNNRTDVNFSNTLLKRNIFEKRVEDSHNDSFTKSTDKCQRNEFNANNTLEKSQENITEQKQNNGSAKDNDDNNKPSNKSNLPSNLYDNTLYHYSHENVNEAKDTSKNGTHENTSKYSNGNGNEAHTENEKDFVVRRRQKKNESNNDGRRDSHIISRPLSTMKSEDVADGLYPVCHKCDKAITRGPFITALGRIWCPEHFICVNATCRRHLQDIGFVEENGQLYCEFCFEQYIAPACDKCHGKIKGDCLNAIGKHFHPECFNCVYCGKLFGNNPFFLEDGLPYCESDWNELFTTKCFACGFPVEAGDRWVEALNNNYHSQCFNCTVCKKNLEGQSFFAKGGRPFCKTHAR